MHTLPAGLINNNGELFAHDGKPCLLTGSQVLDFEEFSSELINALTERMYQYPAMMRAYSKMGAITELDQVRQFTYCNWGKFDHVADIIDGQLQAPEFWLCPQRATCAYNGVGCNGLITQTGEKLTGREIEYIVLTAKGELDKTIADAMQITIYTVTTHSRNVRRKTGLPRKADLAVFAIQHNLLS